MSAYDRRPADRVIEFIKSRLTAAEYTALDSVIASAGGYDSNTVAFDQRPSTSPFQKSFEELYPVSGKIRIS
jgi:hypothetical protein